MWKKNMLFGEKLYITSMARTPNGVPMSSNPDITLESWENGWDISSWEIDRVAQLLHVINEFNGFAARPDTISWVHSRMEDSQLTSSIRRKWELNKASIG
ncbi:hypothetical protein H5410_016215 [Solanum commersonii]|uniref:Uncharacterized protein n=1 Tax=Solanum commersonii TaxID=4109 RepID=A0A9J5ZWX9_SOLCO|nr:hypothetical protein H5410_016215 [Solanum commersonii]